MLCHDTQETEMKGCFQGDELPISIIQGLIIAAGTLTIYYIFMSNGRELAETRTIVFTTLITSNIFLTFVDRSFTKTFLTTVRYKNNLVAPLMVTSVLFLSAFLLIPFVRNLFELSTISKGNFLVCLGISFISVAWFEIYKASLRESSDEIFLQHYQRSYF